MTIAVTNNRDRERYEITVDGELAGFSEYRGGGPVLAITHTEIDPRFEGRGLGSRLVAEELDDVRAQGLHVLPVCPFVQAFLGDPDHRRYLDLVEPQHRRAFRLPEP